MRSVIVSAFVLQRNGHCTHDPDKYLRNFRHLAETGLPIVLFLDRAFEGKVNYPNVEVHPISISELPIWDLLRGDVVLPSHRNERKDTLDFLVIQNSKTEFVRRAAELHPEAERLSWVDFGVAHVLRTPDDTLRRLARLPNAPAGVTIPGCWPEPCAALDHVVWRFSGGFFTADRASALKMAEAHSRAVAEILPTFTWEVNVWAWMERAGFPFHWIYGDHDDSLFNFPTYDSGTSRYSTQTSRT